MKRNSIFTIVGLLIFLMLCFVPSGQAQTQTCVPVAQGTTPPWQLGTKCVFTSASTPVAIGNVSGLSYFQILFVPSGTVSGATLSVDSSAAGSSFTTGGIIAAASIGAMTSAGSYANSSATTPTNYGQLTPTITGSGNVTVIVFGYVNSPSASSGGGSVTVSNFPSTQAVQPAGFSSAVDFVQSVTTSAAALASNATHSFSVCASPSNTINVFVGPSTVTTSGSTAGLQLQPGQCAGWQLSNTNLRYVIAASSGQSVNVTGS